MRSQDLGSAFTACPDDTPKRLQVWFSAPITCACLTRSGLQAMRIALVQLSAYGDCLFATLVARQSGCRNHIPQHVGSFMKNWS